MAEPTPDPTTSTLPPHSSPSPSPSPSLAPPSPAEAARLKREARKAKILARGSDRLARITQTGRGEEGSKLYASPPPAAAAAPSPSLSAGAGGTSTPKLSTATFTGEEEDEDDLGARNARQRPAARAEHADPEEVDISHFSPSSSSVAGGAGGKREEELASLQAEMWRNTFGGGGGGGSGNMGEFNPLQALLGVHPGAGAGAAQGPGGAQGMPDFASFLAQMQGQQGAGPGPGMVPPDVARQSSKKTFADKLFDLLHFLAMLGLAVFVVVGWRSQSGAGVNGAPPPEKTEDAFEGVQAAGAGRSMGAMERWASLGWQKPHPDEVFGVGGASSVDSIPIFWIFVTIELVLQTTRLLLFKNRPPPSSTLYAFSAYLPFPTLRILLQTLARYWSLASSMLTDLALLVFAVGLMVTFAGWTVREVGSEKGTYNVESTGRH